MEKILTISIAAYNVSEFLPKALDSLINCKSIDKIEIFIVNDGSKDETLAVAEDYRKLCPQSLKIIDKKNGGYGSTINAALEQATGKYFKLLDGDDWFETNNLDEFILFLEKCSDDMVFTKFTEFYEPDFIKQKIIEQTYEYNKTFTADKVSEYNMHAMAVKTELIKGKISITEHCFYTDVEFFLKCLIHCETCISIPLNVYCYRIGREGQSISVAGIIKHYDEHEFVSKNAIEIVEKNSNISGIKIPIYRMAARNMSYLLLLPTSKANYNKFKSFRRFVKAKCPLVKKEYSFLCKVINIFPIFYYIFPHWLESIIKSNIYTNCF